MIVAPFKRAQRRRAAVALALAVSGLAGCDPKPPPTPPAPVVVTAAPLAMSVTDWDDYLGQFTAVDSVDVRPRVSGYLTSVGFRDGQMVKKGQVLFTIDPRPYQAVVEQTRGQVARAEATLVNARAEAARGQVLLTSKSISQQSFDTLTATEKQAEADLASARGAASAAALNLGFTRVTAPLSGRVSDRRAAPGNLVTADTTVLTNIVSVDPIWFSFTGSEAMYLKYERANLAGTRTSSRFTPNPVEIRLQDEPSWRWKGHMDFVDNALSAGSGTIRGRAVVANPDGLLTPGMFGHLRLLGSGAYPALLIPEAAVMTDQERQVVFVVGPDHVARFRPVELGPRVAGLRVVRSGVTARDTIIIDGVQRAQSGHPVSPRPGRVVAGPDAAPVDIEASPIASTAKAVGGR